MEIESEYWRFALPTADGKAANLATLQRLPWFELSAEDVLAQWPVVTAENGERYPGRPSIKDLILSELDARASRGETREGIAAEAGELLGWAKRTHPTTRGLPSTAKVIENQIRDRFNAVKAGLAKRTK